MTRWDLLGAMCVLGFAGALVGKLQPQASTPSPAAQTDAPIALGEEWLGLRFRGERVGYAHVIKGARPGGLRYRVDTRFKLLAGQAMHVVISADLSPTLVLERFTFEVDAAGMTFGGTGTVVPDAIELRIRTGGEEQIRRVPVSAPPALRDTLGPLLSQRDLSPGQVHTLVVFDPVSQAEQSMRIEVVGPSSVVRLGEAVPCTALRQTIRGLTLSACMNARGEMLRQELGLGLVAVRETEEEARWGYVQAQSGRTSADLRQATAIPVADLGDLGQRARLRLRLGGLPDATDLTDERQRFQDGVLTIQRETVGAGLTIPAKATAVAPEDLAAEPLVQVEHPKIQAVARRAMGDASDTVQAAKRLMGYVHDHVEEAVVVGVPSALEVLQSGRGDCNEHAALFAALARAAGVPTRIVAGVVYQDGRFTYHAWNEVQTATGWLSVDPTWNQMPADVGHVRLVRGGAGAQLDLLQYMGKLRIQPVR